MVYLTFLRPGHPAMRIPSQGGTRGPFFFVSLYMAFGYLERLELIILSLFLLCTKEISYHLSEMCSLLCTLVLNKCPRQVTVRQLNLRTKHWMHKLISIADLVRDCKDILGMLVMAA
mgnify:CR=1 FL=1